MLPRYCDRVVLLAGGKLIKKGTPLDVLNSDEFARAFHGRWRGMSRLVCPLRRARRRVFVDELHEKRAARRHRHGAALRPAVHDDRHGQDELFLRRARPFRLHRHRHRRALRAAALPIWWAVGLAVAFALLFSFVRSRSSQSADTIIGVFFVHSSRPRHLHRHDGRRELYQIQ